MLFNKEAQKLYQSGPFNIDSVRQDITIPAKQIEIQVPGAQTTATSSNVFDVTEPRILLAFRYSSSANENQSAECKQFLNDSVFFEIDKDQAVQWQDQLKQGNPCRQEELYSANNLHQLKELYKRRQAVVVKSFKGKLIPTITFDLEIKNGKALSLMFSLEQNGQGTP